MHQLVSSIFSIYKFGHWPCLNALGLIVVSFVLSPHPTSPLACIGQSPRRNCCRVLKSKKKGVMEIDVGVCRPGEVSEV